MIVKPYKKRRYRFTDIKSGKDYGVFNTQTEMQKKTKVSVGYARYWVDSELIL